MIKIEKTILAKYIYNRDLKIAPKLIDAFQKCDKVYYENVTDGVYSLILENNKSFFYFCNYEKPNYLSFDGTHAKLYNKKYWDKYHKTFSKHAFWK